MAKTIIEDEQLNRYSLRSWIRVIIYGAVVGLVYWLLALAISKLIVEPFACRQIVEAASCVNASVVAGKITTVIVTALAIGGMVRMSVTRPIIIAIAAAIVLWPLAEYTQGLFWLESLAWAVGLYTVVYALFGWIARAAGVAIAVILAAVIAIGIRILLIV